VSDLGYLDIRPILARLADLDRELVLVGGQAVNFWVWWLETQRGAADSTRSAAAIRS
jgi:hypothetical protein